MRDSSIAPLWKGWHKAHTSLTPLLQILSRGWEIRGPRASPLHVAELHQLAFGHLSSGRKALGTEVPFSPLTTPFISGITHVDLPGIAQALPQLDTPRNPPSGSSFAGLNNAFFVLFYLTPPCLLLCYPANPELVSQPASPVLLSPEKPLCIFAGFQQLLNAYFRQWLFRFLAFLQIIRQTEPPAGSMDLILKQLSNSYPGHCIPILSCVVWQNRKNRLHSAQIYWG